MKFSRRSLLAALASAVAIFPGSAAYALDEENQAFAVFETRMLKSVAERIRALPPVLLAPDHSLAPIVEAEKSSLAACLLKQSTAPLSRRPVPVPELPISRPSDVPSLGGGAPLADAESGEVHKASPDDAQGGAA